ncbi:MAG: ATPase involved in DNA replication HolB small subunit [Candidatus Methanohalarchaeum thermophilum]|uniref:Replication factor C small subunit n=1 Tax=Methanohalarchaeum thermophilum TaxID=1903181 RepID=A0A1Q6DXU5_METT1|nr:MAG: ATPase involved in DNA replication HolB small subunit [Candidatus Methanohalarchaeum thermophilum]
MSGGKQEIWIEKYRPDRLDDVVGQDEITKRLKSYVKTGNLPHLLFAGPPGVGKTASAVAIAKELFGETWRDNFTELNASDERGIDVVRSKIKNFARSSTIGDADYKVIFLDESDSLTSDAQSALRRTMEKFSDNARFILSANYSSKIIEPIQSRCAVFRFSRIPEEAIEERIKYIIDEEDIEISEEAIRALKNISSGDMRRAINTLQSAASLEGEIKEDDVFRISAKPHPREVKAMMKKAVTGSFMEAKEDLNELMEKRGLAGEDIIKEIHNSIFELDIPNKRKIEIIDRVGDVEYYIIEGADSRLQLESLLAKLSLIPSQ